MPQRIAIIGAAGQIASQLAKRLIEETEYELVLIGRNVSTRLSYLTSERVQFVDAVFSDSSTITQALQNVDVAYINSLSYVDDTRSLLEAIATAQVPRIIGATIAGVEQEVPDPLASWTWRHLPQSYVQGEQQSAQLVASSGIPYILLRLTWLFDDASNTQYELVESGKPFNDAEVSREAVVQAILDILDNKDLAWNTSYGVGQPGTHYGKPSFY